MQTIDEGVRPRNAIRGLRESVRSDRTLGRAMRINPPVSGAPSFARESHQALNVKARLTTTRETGAVRAPVSFSLPKLVHAPIAIGLHLRYRREQETAGTATDLTSAVMQHVDLFSNSLLMALDMSLPGAAQGN